MAGSGWGCRSWTMKICIRHRQPQAPQRAAARHFTCQTTNRRSKSKVRILYSVGWCAFQMKIVSNIVTQLSSGVLEVAKSNLSSSVSLKQHTPKEHIGDRQGIQDDLMLILLKKWLLCISDLFICYSGMPCLYIMQTNFLHMLFILFMSAID